MRELTLWVYVACLAVYGGITTKSLAYHEIGSGWVSLLILGFYLWIVIQLSSRALSFNRIEWYLKEKRKQKERE